MNAMSLALTYSNRLEMCEIDSDVSFAGHFGEGYSKDKHHFSKNCLEDSLCAVKEHLVIRGIM